MRISCYCKKTGDITQICTAMDETLLHFYDNEDEGYIVGSYDPELYRVDLSSFNVVAIPDAEISSNGAIASWGNFRAKRNKHLVETDWTQVPDAPVNQQAWATYRQALRDLPENTTDPENPDWPVPPTN